MEFMAENSEDMRENGSKTNNCVTAFTTNTSTKNNLQVFQKEKGK